MRNAFRSVISILEIKNPTIRAIASWESSRRRREVNVKKPKGASKTIKLMIAD